ncbi:uncharacterized protein EHS24_006729 [Apiotrichum porosum]|uniref:Uncharacterized protein n=1 Tax=Apiotrichum porosum TaxID=105984 RepID=A0A427XCD5_9TREE|nr:uncharacterized protein EHS24_006729 [Apiotrichum porosum]RSH76498.1 hypothetical protein EHS24_006729 [Apiotrichum porosum]
MPVTFAPAPEHQRRLSASSPFPGRIMTSLVPSDPRYTSTSTVQLVVLAEARRRGSRYRARTSAWTNSPQEERMPLYAVDEEDAERQPLLGDDGPRPDVQWALTLGITVAIAAITF